MSENKMSVENLLDANLDDLNDLPEFRHYPAGSYVARLTVSHSTNEAKELIIEAEVTLLEVAELAVPTVEADGYEAPPELKDKSTKQFNLHNQFGEGNFKACFQAVKEHFGITSVRDIINACQGVDVLMVCGKPRGMKKSADNYDPSVKYTNIMSFTPL